MENLVFNPTKNVEKNAVPLIGYYDIFKNYYANTQEEKFYTIGGTLPLQATYEGVEIPNSGNNIALSNGSKMVFSNVTNIEDVVLIGSENSRYRKWKPRRV